MKLRTKIFITFAGALALYIVIAFFGLTTVLDSLSTKMMKKQAENITRFLLHRIALSLEKDLPGNIHEDIDDDLLIAKIVSDESRGFQLKKILLINPEFTVIAGFPEEETGTSYAGHEDIREAFTNRDTKTVVEETKNPDKTITKDIDVVSWFTDKRGKAYVLEVKLDFAESITLLEAQYRTIETGAIAVALLLLTGLLGVLLIIMGRTVIRPVMKVTRAMESVGKGDLELILDERSRDEFGLLAKRFNEMVAGLREKFRLYNYVSQGTINAVRDSLGGEDAHHSRRIEAVLFFSDIRGFTAFSESRDPESVIGTLNKILSLQTEIIKKHNGDVDKFVGDEVMAVFREPEDAIEAALKIQEEMSRLRPGLENLQLGIGIHKGSVMQGDVGSTDIRDFTVIGDNVNTAARLESVAAGGEILVSEITARAGNVRHLYRFRLKGPLNLKGKTKPINTLLISGRKEPYNNDYRSGAPASVSDHG